MNLITLRLLDKLDNKKKASIFDAFNNHDAYEITSETEFNNDIEEFEFKNKSTDVLYKLSFNLKLCHVQISSAFLSDKKIKKEFQEQIEDLFRDNYVNLKEGKIIKLHSLEKYLEKFKQSNKLESSWKSSLGNLILWSTALTPVFLIETTWGLNKESITKIFISLVFVIYSISIAIEYFKNRRCKNIKEFSDPQKEAKRIFDELKDY